MKLDIIYNEDCLEGMRKRLPDKSIDLTVTSPPYDNLRTYGGYIFDFESIAQELYRVTKDGGIVVWVVGDATINGSETGTSFRQALYFKEVGFNLHDTMIYFTNKPPAKQDRYHQDFEYMFIFSRGKPGAFNPILVKSLFPGQRNTGKHRKRTGELQISKRKQDRTASLKIKGNIWYLPRSSQSGDKYSRKHPATFPEQLVSDHIITWTNEGDLILDPMFGSGTTLKMAKKNHRHYIGFEINPEYCEIAKQRLEAERTLWDK